MFDFDLCVVERFWLQVAIFSLNQFIIWMEQEIFGLMANLVEGDIHKIAIQGSVSLDPYLFIHLPIDVHRAVFTPWTKLQLPFLYFCLGNGEI